MKRLFVPQHNIQKSKSNQPFFFVRDNPLPNRTKSCFITWIVFFCLCCYL